MKTTPAVELEVDMDKACTLCGEPGATKSGRCLKCVAALVRTFKDRSIGFHTLTAAKTEICALIDEEAEKIDQAYVKADGDVTVALTLKLTGTRMIGKVEAIATINFVDSRTKRSVKFVVEEKQMDLPGV